MSEKPTYAQLEQRVRELEQAEAERRQKEATAPWLQNPECLSRMARAIAHRSNNLLAVATGNLEMALHDMAGKAVSVDKLSEALTAARRASEICSLMQIYMGQARVRLEPMDLSEICRKVLSDLEPDMPENTGLYTALPKSGPLVKANAGQIHQLFKNLMLNALESFDNDAGQVSVSIRAASPEDIPPAHRLPVGFQPGKPVYACLEVTDTGCGVEKDMVEQLFDPFYSTKLTDRGLGLAVALHIVQTHEGCLTVEAEPGQGSAFQVFLPLATEAVTRAKAAPQGEGQAAVLGHGGTVLLVDDEPAVRNTGKQMLMRLGMNVLEAGDGIEAVNVFQKNQHKVQCVLCDLNMPRMRGWETIAALRRLDPCLPVVLASGNDPAHAMSGFHSEQPQAFLSKPYRLADLKDALVRALNTVSDSCS